MTLNSRTKVLIAIGILLIVLGIIAGFRLLSPEDSWICSNGQWEKHGQPKSIMPVRECLK